MNTLWLVAGATGGSMAIIAQNVSNPDLPRPVIRMASTDLRFRYFAFEL